jgi:hypothetical protein
MNNEKGYSQQQDPVSALLSEFSTRLNEIEEKQRLIKDRLLLVGENLVSTKEEFENQTLEFKKQLKEIAFDLKKIKQINKRVVDELGNLARKNELEILERQFELFKPLEFARIKDVENIIEKRINEQNKDIKNKKSE